MRIRSLAWLSMISLVFATVGTGAVAAQEGRITCESAGGNYQYCRVNTDNNVTLEKQLSFSECRQNYSWGYDRRGIWVDRGCRAEFSYGRRSGTNAAVAGAIIGGAILAGVLASRGNSNSDIRSDNSAYDYGYNSGRSDALGGLSNTPSRHESRVDRSYRNAYSNGYESGFRAGADTRNQNAYGAGNSNDQRNAYQRGYSAGSRDASAHMSSSFVRYRSEYNRDTMQSFRNGYEAGYSKNNQWSYDRGDSNSRVPNWLMGTWETDQGTQRIEMTFSSSGQVAITVIPRRGRRTTSSGYYSNGVMVFPGFASYDVRRSRNQMVAVNVKNSSDSTTYSRIR